ncbi:MAG: prepilin peptidase [Candidatus Pacebacteria bacterium]|nr:prepilin peptidase [Candidatus Paceibacterota bacterium]
MNSWDTPVTPRDILIAAGPMCAVVMVVLGACIGSFLNVVVWRLPRGESLVRPPSHCPKCGTQIKPWENIPVLSWLVLRGRCRHCGQPIAVRYVLVELATACLFLLVWWRFSAHPLPASVLPGWLFLVSALLAVALIDLRHSIIPNQITYTGCAIGLGLAVLLPASRARIAGLEKGLGTTVELPWRYYKWLPEGMQTYLRGIALLDACLGLAAGWVLLWLVATIGKRIWGSRQYVPERPAALRMDAETVRIGEDREQPWNEILWRSSARFTARVDKVRVSVRSPGTEETEDAHIDGPVQLAVTPNHVAVGRRELLRSDLKALHARASEWHVPQEVMGMGDVKLLAMIGVFLGYQAIMFVVAVSALCGCLAGVGRYFFWRQAHEAVIPYGPFLALAATIWLFMGPEMANWYQQFLMDLVAAL